MIYLSLSGSLPSGVTPALAKRAVEEAFLKARRKADGALAIRFVTETEIAKLNKQYRGKARPTDVLSFAPNFPVVASGSEREYGDLFICSAYAKREAKRRGIPFEEEIVRLMVHGTLHLLGYDHATDEEETRMFGLQERAIATILP